jgi:hypothetical protein
VHQNGRNHHCHRAKRIGENVQENSMHILIAMSVVMAVIVTMVVMSVLEAENADQIDKETSDTDS